MYDVAIIGAGPAGSTLARLIGGRRRVLLVDARDFSDPPPAGMKCCGGLLAPDASTMLNRMELEIPATILDSGQPIAVRAVDLVSGHERLYPRAHANLNRLAFERWLLSLIPESVAVRGRHCCVGLSPVIAGQGWTIRLKGPDGETTKRALVVVGADGAGSMVRRALDAAPRADVRYVAVQDHYLPPEDWAPACFGDEYVAFFHPGLTDFYGWLIPKHDSLLMGMAIPPARRRSALPTGLMRTARAMLEKRGYAFPDRYFRRAAMVLRPAPGDVFWGGRDAWCIGEAAGFISPSSAEGYSYAFASA